MKINWKSIGLLAVRLNWCLVGLITTLSILVSLNSNHFPYRPFSPNTKNWLFRRSRKRRSNRRKASQHQQQQQQQQQNACNAGLAPLNQVDTNYEMNSNSSYVMNASGADTSSPSKKRKMSNQDLPGPSSCKSNDEPMSEFYKSLLESSYQDDLNCMCPIESKEFFFSSIWKKNVNRFFLFVATLQLSEEEMIQKALQMSRLEFMQSKAI